MTLRERIKKLCKEKGCSVNQLEIDCGFGKGYVSKLDKSKPNSEKLQKIADYLDVSLDYLMNGEKTEFESYQEQAELFAKIRHDEKILNAFEKFYKLSDKKKEHIIELIDLLGEASE